MGLDMYLFAKRAGAPTIDEYHAAMDQVAWPEGQDKYFVFEGYKAAKAEANVEVAYWRKANAIHAWFVDNFQAGVDECQLSDPISREALAGLVERCKRVEADPSLAQELLPPRSGFFFGGTDVDEMYLHDLKETIAQLEPLVAEPGIEFFVYQSSW